MDAGAVERNQDTQPENLGKVTPIKRLKLADGKEYELCPINTNILVEVEDKFNMPLAELLQQGRISPIRYLVFLQIHRNHPEMTEEQVGELMSLEVLEDMRKILGVGS